MLSELYFLATLIANILVGRSVVGAIEITIVREAATLLFTTLVLVYFCRGGGRGAGRR